MVNCTKIRNITKEQQENKMQQRYKILCFLQCFKQPIYKYCGVVQNAKSGNIARFGVDFLRILQY